MRSTKLLYLLTYLYYSSLGLENAVLKPIPDMQRTALKWRANVPRPRTVAEPWRRRVTYDLAYCNECI